MKLYKRGNSPHWWYEFFVPGTRQRVRKSTGEVTKYRAGIVANDAYSKVREAQDSRILRKSPTLRDYAPQFLQWIEDTNKKPSTVTAYRSAVAALLKTKLADMRLSEIRSFDVETCGFSGYSGDQRIAVMRKLFTVAKESGNFFGEIPKLKRLKKDLKPRSIAMTEMDAEKIAGNMTGDAKDVLLILRATGMRPMELFRSRWEHVDLDAGSLYVEDTKTAAGRRFVPLLGALPILHRRHLEAGLPKSGWIFPSKSRRSGHLETIRDEFIAARDKAGFPPEMVLYCARHGYATVAAQVLSTKELQTVLGHADAATTYRYQHVDSRLLATKLQSLETNGHIN